MTHELKCHPEYFKEVFERTKEFEVRENDRGFKVDDTLHIREWNHEKQKYMKGECFRRVTYILTGGQFGIEKGYVVMSIK